MKIPAKSQSRLRILLEKLKTQLSSLLKVWHLSSADILCVYELALPPGGNGKIMTSAALLFVMMY